MGATEDLLTELSSDQMQELMDQMLGRQSFDFAEYLQELVTGKQNVSALQVLERILAGVGDTLLQEKRMILSLIVIGLIGAVFTSFTKLLQGKQVAQTAFYVVYLLFFSVLMVSYQQTAGIATKTLNGLLDFMKALLPAYFISMSFCQGGAAAGVYYEFTLSMLAVVNLLLVRFAIPGIHVYFFLQLTNQLSKEDLFSKMAELIRDVVKLVMKALFGFMTGMNVVQGLLVPAAAEVKNGALLQMENAIPGVGNAMYSVTQTVLSAGVLVKNAVGVGGMVVILLLCGIPFLRILTNQLLYQLAGALLQPVSNPHLVECLGGTVEAMKLLLYAVGTGGMLFVTSIAIISGMTS